MVIYNNGSLAGAKETRGSTKRRRKRYSFLLFGMKRWVQYVAPQQLSEKCADFLTNKLHGRELICTLGDSVGKHLLVSPVCHAVLFSVISSMKTEKTQF
jgi:hypothetical protein